MMEQAIHKVVIIGCGNVAWHLALKLRKQKNIQLFIYNHKANNDLTTIKNELGISAFSNLNTVIKDAHAYFICVSDSAIESVAKKINYLPASANLFITSGNFDLKKLDKHWKNTSIFYPLQTFSKNDEIKWKDISIIIEPSNALTEKKVITYANIFTNDILKLKYQQRLKLHLCAVLVNNFTNSLYVEADKLMKSVRKDLNIKTLYPLIKQGTKKIKYLTPLEAQTGPAKRKDKDVIEKHLSLLRSNKEVAQLYTLLTQLIQTQQK
jgi:predicted short-subunit dehydrogenase-like oxidoreductase (DUF2520 family)